MGNFSDVINNIGRVASVASTIATPIFNWFSQRSTNKQNADINQSNQEFNAEQAELERQYNSAEAEKSRVFNAQQAQQQQDFQKQMWKTYNEYNSPFNQLERMRQAGYNPNWLDVSGNTSATPPQGASATSSPASARGIASPASLPMQAPQLENPVLMASQIRLANSQAKLNEANTNESKERAESIKQLRQGELDLQNVQIHCGLANERLTDAQIDAVYKGCQKLDVEIGVCKQSILNAQQELKNMELQGQLTSKEIAAFERKLQSSIALALSEQAKNYGLANVSKQQCELLAKQVTYQSIQNGVIAIDFNKAIATAPSGTSLVISSNQAEQSYYDWVTGDWFKNTWKDDNKSFGRKVYQTITGYGNWVTHSIGVGMNGSFNMRENKTMIQNSKP